MFKAKNKDTRQIGEKAQHSEVVVAQDKQNFNVALISWLVISKIISVIVAKFMIDLDKSIYDFKQKKRKKKNR